LAGIGNGRRIILEQLQGRAVCIDQQWPAVGVGFDGRARLARFPFGLGHDVPDPRLDHGIGDGEFQARDRQAVDKSLLQHNGVVRRVQAQVSGTARKPQECDDDSDCAHGIILY